MKVLSSTQYLAALSLLSCSFITLADQPSLSFVEVGYGQLIIDDDDFDIDPSGFNLAASFEINESWYIPVSYFKYSDDFSLEEGGIVANGFSQTFAVTTDIDLSQFSLGIGYQFGMSNDSIIAVDVNYINVKADASIRALIVEYENGVELSRFNDSYSDSESDSGVSARVNYMAKLTDSFQLGVGIKQSYIRIDSENISETAFNVEVLYFLNEQFAGKFFIETTSDTDEFNLVLSARYSF